MFFWKELRLIHLPAIRGYSSLDEFFRFRFKATPWLLEKGVKNKSQVKSYYLKLWKSWPLIFRFSSACKELSRPARPLFPFRDHALAISFSLFSFFLWLVFRLWYLSTRESLEKMWITSYMSSLINHVYNSMFFQRTRVRDWMFFFRSYCSSLSLLWESLSSDQMNGAGRRKCHHLQVNNNMGNEFARSSSFFILVLLPFRPFLVSDSCSSHQRIMCWTTSQQHYSNFSCLNSLTVTDTLDSWHRRWL